MDRVCTEHAISSLESDTLSILHAVFGSLNNTYTLADSNNFWHGTL